MQIAVPSLARTGVQLKRCHKCGELKPADSDYFARNCESRDGLRSVCKACRRLADKTYRIQRRSRED